MVDIKQIKEKASSLRILVVDDEELIRILMTSFMERLFGEVVSAVDGQDALEKFNHQGPFDMVLTDIRMPRINGMELIKELRRIDQKLFIAMMSGAPEDAEDDLRNCDVFIEKPVGFDKILDVLSQMIQSKGL
jgi:two-component system response regulator YesN